jgi:hypothetical protein
VHMGPHFVEPLRRAQAGQKLASKPIAQHACVPRPSAAPRCASRAENLAHSAHLRARQRRLEASCVATAAGEPNLIAHGSDASRGAF